MNSLSSKQRKLVYVLGIIVLMVPIIALGMPASDEPGSGGYIAQLRQEHELGESTLGNVDPASATMNLVLLGLRGIAANLLWMEADDLKNRKEWAQLNSTVNSIILLQPHYLSVWRFQGWNLGYNVSAEVDDVEDRYYWVKEGAKFLQKGIDRNRDQPELYHDLGMFLSQKVGRADEKEQFRKYFRQDPDEYFDGGPDEALNPDGLDNYLVAKQWYEVANDKELLPGTEQHKMDRTLFRASPARAQFDYAQALQKDAKGPEAAAIWDESRNAWEVAYDDWTQKYGRELFLSPGGKVMLESSLSDIEDLAEEDGVSIEEKWHWTNQYQKMTNYLDWKERGLVERQQKMLNARKDLQRGRELFLDESEFEQARAHLERGMAGLAEVFEEYPRISQDVELIEDTIKSLLMWRYTLVLDGIAVPTTYPLKNVWDAYPEDRERFDRIFRQRFGSSQQ